MMPNMTLFVVCSVLFSNVMCVGNSIKCFIINRNISVQANVNRQTDRQTDRHIQSQEDSESANIAAKQPALEPELQQRQVRQNKQTHGHHTNIKHKDAPRRKT